MMKLGMFMLFLVVVLTIHHAQSILLNRKATSPVKTNTASSISRKDTSLKARFARIVKIEAEKTRPTFAKSPILRSILHKSSALTTIQQMIAGAVSHSIANAVVHPVTTYKTMVQLNQQLTTPITFSRLLRGIDSQLLFSIPLGAVHGVIRNKAKVKFSKYIPAKFEFLTDFSASAVSTFACSLLTTPQMVLGERLMAGTYPNMRIGAASIYDLQGISGFYSNWLVGMAERIPTQGLTHALFEHLERSVKRNDKLVNLMTAAASAVCLTMPLDVVKTKMIAHAGSANTYRDITDCMQRILSTDGELGLYRGLGTRLLSHVPAQILEVDIYENMKTYYTKVNAKKMLGINDKKTTEAFVAAGNSSKKYNK